MSSPMKIDDNGQSYADLTSDQLLRGPFFHGSGSDAMSQQCQYWNSKFKYPNESESVLQSVMFKDSLLNLRRHIFWKDQLSKYDKRIHKKVLSKIQYNVSDVVGGSDSGTTCYDSMIESGTAESNQDQIQNLQFITKLSHCIRTNEYNIQRIFNIMKGLPNCSKFEDSDSTIVTSITKIPGISFEPMLQGILSCWGGSIENTSVRKQAVQKIKEMIQIVDRQYQQSKFQFQFGNEPLNDTILSQKYSMLFDGSWLGRLLQELASEDSKGDCKFSILETDSLKRSLTKALIYQKDESFINDTKIEFYPYIFSTCNRVSHNEDFFAREEMLRPSKNLKSYQLKILSSWKEADQLMNRNSATYLLNQNAIPSYSTSSDIQNSYDKNQIQNADSSQISDPDKSINKSDSGTQSNSSRILLSTFGMDLKADLNGSSSFSFLTKLIQARNFLKPGEFWIWFHPVLRNQENSLQKMTNGADKLGHNMGSDSDSDSDEDIDDENVLGNRVNKKGKSKDLKEQSQTVKSAAVAVNSQSQCHIGSSNIDSQNEDFDPKTFLDLPIDLCEKFLGQNPNISKFKVLHSSKLWLNSSGGGFGYTGNSDMKSMLQSYSLVWCFVAERVK